EDVEKGKITPEEYVAETARRKILHVYEQALRQQEEDEQNKNVERPADPDLVISADTVIATRSGRILEKPRDEQHHLPM
ncbi:Maf family protein, partial [Escherichia coli]|nr:Maf family protein [Escherichia coli]